MRISEQGVSGLVEEGDGLRSGHRREILKKTIERVARFEIVNKRADRDTSARKDGCATKNVR